VTDQQGKTLLRLARSAIENALGFASSGFRREAWMNELGATFVTLFLKGKLKGCIGSVEERRSLWEDVRQNAVSAALRDHRFPPLQPAEAAEVEIELSVCSPLTEMVFATEAEALAQLRPGVDGVLLEYRGARSTFLPQVWDKLAEPKRFLTELKKKAGLDPHFWSENLRLFRYTVARWREREFGGGGAEGA